MCRRGWSGCREFMVMEVGTLWRRSNRFSREALPLADRHYSRQRYGSPQFVAPGRNIVLLHPLTLGCATALWVSRWQFAEYAKHEWAGAWECSLFRNEGDMKSSDLIRSAVAATRAIWGAIPKEGFITFVNPRKVRKKRDPGRCFLRAGFERVGETQKGLVVLKLNAADAPDPVLPIAMAGPSLFEQEWLP
jgi:hypothetical protein